MQTKANISLPSTDAEIASSASALLEASPIFPSGSVKATVNEGWITLEGEHEWWFQKNAAAYAVHDIPEVRGVINLITIAPFEDPGGNRPNS